MVALYKQVSFQTQMEHAPKSRVSRTFHNRTIFFVEKYTDTSPHHIHSYDILQEEHCNRDIDHLLLRREIYISYSFTFYLWRPLLFFFNSYSIGRNINRASYLLASETDLSQRVMEGGIDCLLGVPALAFLNVLADFFLCFAMFVGEYHIFLYT